MPATVPTENDLVTQHTGLITVQAALFNPTSLSDFDDYMSAGRIGLLKAIRNYKEDGGAKFSTYATICIRREMIRESQSDKDRMMERRSHGDPAQPKVQDNLNEWWEILPKTLTATELRVLEARVLENYTLKEIGEEHGHSKQWAGITLKKVFKKIREQYDEET